MSEKVDPKLVEAGERETMRLPVKLSENEVLLTLRDVAHLEGQIASADAALEAEKERAKAVVKEAEGRAKALRLRAQERALVARSGEEYREVEVKVVIDRAARRRVVVRTDTMAVVESAPASRDELTRGCDWISDMEKGVSRLTHIPTGAVVEERLLTAEERQLTIDATAPRELVWISGGTWANLTADEVESLECPVPKGTRVKWEKSGDWQLATVPVGATLNGVMHQLAVANIPFKVGNDAPKTIGDLSKRATDEASSKVVGIKSKRAPKSEG